MFDVGWTELLVIAVVLIVVVGPKDLPPMLRAFGKTTARFRKVAGEFRAQFDEALREAELDDVRQTIADAQKLNPMSSLRDAMNPLRQMGNEIKADLQRSTTVDQPAATPAIPVSEPSMGLPEATMGLPEATMGLPETPAIAPTPVKAADPAPLMMPLEKPKAVRKPRAKAPVKVEAVPVVAETVVEKPKRAPRRAAAPVVVAETPAATPKKRAPAKKKDNA